jgi:hypothetical protein
MTFWACATTFAIVFFMTHLNPNIYMSAYTCDDKCSIMGICNVNTHITYYVSKKYVDK